MPIYTKTGDDGTTSLFGGKRVLKCDELVEVYGSVDELNSYLGYIAAKPITVHLCEFIKTVQMDLFEIGANLAGWESDLSNLSTRVTQMEVEIDAMSEKLPELTNFILPGGTENSSIVHIARSICRRVERQTVALKDKEKVSREIIKYLNRLSDMLFVLARYINKEEGGEEAVWKGIRK